MQKNATRTVLILLAVTFAMFGMSCSSPSSPPGDTTAPTVSIFSSTLDPTGESPMDVSIVFSEAVTGFEVGDLTLSANVSAGSFATGDNTTFTVELTPSTAEETITLGIAAGVCTDEAGNLNEALGTAFSRFYTLRPAPAISSSAADPTNASPLLITITFNEAVESFTDTDLARSNCTIGNFTNSVPGTEWTAELTPLAQGLVEASVPEGVCSRQGSPGVTNAASTTFSRTFDSAAPGVTLSSTEPEPTNTSIQITVTFSEPIASGTFTAGDITVSGGGSAANLATTDDTVFTADVTPGGDGTVTIDIGAGACTDPAGNLNTAASSLNRTYDSTGPTVTLGSTAANPTNASPFPITITFNEQVTGFDSSDLTVGNGTAGAMSGGPLVYNCDITPAGEGAVTINLGAGACTDLLGNLSSAASSLSRTYDLTGPTVTLSGTSPTNASPFLITITFNEPLASGSFTAGDITVTGGSAANLATTDDTVFTAEVTPGGEGTVTIDIGAGVCADQAGNPNSAAAATLDVAYDITAPGATLSSTEPEPTNTSIQIIITFDEPIAGGTFTAGDITVSGGGSAANLATTDETVFTADVTPGAQGSVSISLGAGVCADPAGNLNTAAPSGITRTYDTNPVPVITSTTQTRTNANPIPLTITFDEPVTGFASTDLTVGNGTAGAVSGGPAVYTCDLTPAAAGLVTVDIAAGACLDQDGAADANAAATQLTRTRITTLGYDTRAFISAGTATASTAAFSIAANSNRILVASVYVKSTGTAPTISSVTYGGTGMTLVPGSAQTHAIAGPPNRYMLAALYYLKDPAAGTALSVTATISVTPNIVWVGAVSLYDAYVHGGSDPIGTVAKTDAGATNAVTTNLSTAADYSWLVDVMAGDSTSSSFTAGVGQISRWSGSAGQGCSASSTKPTATAGAASMGWTLGTSQPGALIHSVAEIKIAQ